MSSVKPSTSPETYDEAIRLLYERINYEKGHAPYSDAHYRLDRMRRLLAALHDPHLAAPVIHIAGTKGKGSTATFLSQMLSGSGFRTGLYTSPHLVRLEERFRINGQPLSAAQLVRLTEQVLVAADRVESEGGGRATFFELTTAVACLHFAEQRCQAVVLEVGLGGRLDSTNVCQPAITVITTLGMDHQAQLGSTLAAIAGEKAGIIKPKIPVVTSARIEEAWQVIDRVARERTAPLRRIQRDFDVRWHPHTPPKSIEGFDLPATAAVNYLPNYQPTELGSSSWSLSMLGAHQADNLGAALATIDWLMEEGWSFDKPSLLKSVQATQVPARLQCVGTHPLRLIDTAHNPDSIAATMDAIDTHFPGTQRTIVLASSRDKDIDGMMKLIAPRCHRLILTQYHRNPRALSIEELLAVAQRYATSDGPITSSAPTPPEAWKLAEQQSAGSTNALICATGSFFLAAELM